MPVRSTRFFVFVCLISLVAACREDLYTGLDERQANEIVAVLYANGISAGRVRAPDNSYAVQVESAALGPAIIVLDEAGIPRNRFETIGEVFPAEGVVGTAFEEHVRYIYALGQELSETVSGIEGVDAARVHIMIPQRTRMRDAAEPSSASVAVYRTPEFDVETSIPSIKTLIAYAVPSLTYENVAVATFDAGGLERIELAPAVPDGAAFASSGLFGRESGGVPTVRQPLINAILALAIGLLVLLLAVQTLRTVSGLRSGIGRLFGRKA